MNDKTRNRPVVIVQTGAMSERDIKRLNDNGLCVVKAKDPSQVRFMEPAPQGYSVQERAAIELARTLLRSGKVGACSAHRADIGLLYADILMQGDPLKPVEHVPGASQ